MVLFLDEIDFSHAVELRFKVKVQGENVNPTITLREQGDRISPRIAFSRYIDFSEAEDGFLTVRIPMKPFKTKTWNAEHVRLVFIGCDPWTAKDEITITVKSLSVWLPRGVGTRPSAR